MWGATLGSWRRSHGLDWRGSSLNPLEASEHPQCGQQGAGGTHGIRPELGKRKGLGKDPLGGKGSSEVLLGVTSPCDSPGLPS